MLSSPFTKSPYVRPSTDEGIKHVREWLRRQDAQGVPGTFYCNWSLTLKNHEERRLLIYEDKSSAEVVGYQWGGLVAPGILEVRADFRRKGVGRALVEHRLIEAFARNEDILYIQCKPASSIPFWRQMGFELLRGEQGKNYAYQILHRPLDLPDEGDEVAVELQWYSERDMRTETRPVSSFSSVGLRTPEGEVFLAERAHCFDGGYNSFRQTDIVVRVAVDGKEHYFGKAKYEMAMNLGVHRCRNGFYVDVLYPG